MLYTNSSHLDESTQQSSEGETLLAVGYLYGQYKAISPESNLSHLRSDSYLRCHLLVLSSQRGKKDMSTTCLKSSGINLVTKITASKIT